MARPPPVPALAGVLLLVLAASSAAAEPFLPQLPLEIIYASPAALLNGGELAVEERQVLQAVFSRPVIALGSDFGTAALPASLTPFTTDCPVPGLGRWTTTTIYRWEPKADWPTDLDCTLKWNSQLKSFDGVPLAAPNASAVAISSPPMRFEVASVSSASADAATDKQWHAYRGLADDSFPEVPPDANLTLTFSHPVQLSLLAAALRVEACCNSSAGAGQRVSVLPCGPPYVVPDPFAAPAARAKAAETAGCAVVQVRPGLPPRAGAILRLPKGSRYNADAGVTKNDTDVYIWGLRRFRVPLRGDFQQLANATDTLDYAQNAISYRRLTLWLPHGLAAGVTAAQLKRQISLCQFADPYDWASKCSDVPFTLTLENKGQALMTVPSLSPRQHYRVAVAASPALRDGFGLPLEASEAFFFSSEPSADMAMPELAAGANVALFEPSPSGAPLPWPVAYRGGANDDSAPRGVSAWPLGGSSVFAAMQVLAGENQPGQVSALLGPPAVSFARPWAQTTQVKVLALPGRPGVQFVAMPTNSSYQGLRGALLVVQSDLQYAGVAIGSRLTHFVTLTQGAATPLAGASVHTALTPYGQKSIRGPSCTTGKDGSCTVDLTEVTRDVYGNIAAVVEAPGHGQLVVSNVPMPSAYMSEAARAPWVGELVLDRGLVMPGDSLHVMGYLQQRAPDGQLSLPAGLARVNVSITPSFAPGADPSSPLVLPVQLNASHGTFHLVLPVPASAKPQDYSIALVTPKWAPGAPPPKLQEGEATTVEIDSDTFVVGSPRPPTAVLNLTAPGWAPPTSSVRLLFAVSSYLGADVSGADISVSWYLPVARGEFNVTTDASGKAAADIDLGRLPPANATSLGDVLSITARFIGPTRETITETASVRIANGPVRVELSRSPATDVPGVPFIASAATWLNDKDDTQLEGVTVEVSLAPNASDSLANCSAAAAAALAAQRCTLVSGRPLGPKPCTLALPCAADLKMLACPVSFANGTAIKGAGGKPGCSESPVGRNASAWAASPWATLPIMALLADRDNYTVGSAATLAFTNAFWRPASGLLVWGNTKLQKTRPLADVAPGPHSITIDALGPECLGGCEVSLVLSLPRAAAAAAKLPDGVPASKLFDPLAPATASGSVHLRVEDDNRLNVSVTVEPPPASASAASGLFKATAEGPDGTPLQILGPKASTTISVKVTHASSGAPAVDAEVTLVVVDQAVLDLVPYPLADVAADMLPYMSLSFSISEINDCRTSRANINTTFATLERRLRADPWLPLVTTITPGRASETGAWGTRSYYPVAASADTSDAKVLREYSSPLTITPAYTWGLSQRYPAGSKGGGDAGAALRLSSDFKTTPLFTVVATRTDGSATARFTAPANLGAFSVRAYAVSKGAAGRPSKYGANETALIVRRPVSLTASLPASVRVGDDFEAGVLVAAPDAAGPVRVEVTATIVAANQTSADASDAAPDGSLVLVQEDPLSAVVALGPAQQQAEVRFRYKASALGASGLRFVARIAGGGAGSGGRRLAQAAAAPALARTLDLGLVSITLRPGGGGSSSSSSSGSGGGGGGGGGSDAVPAAAGPGSDVVDSVQVDVDVLGQQGPVWLSTSFALAAGGNGSSGARREGLALPEAAPGSGSVSLLAGVGFLPAIKASYQAVVGQQEAARADAAAANDGDASSFVPWGPDGVNAALMPAFVARYGNGSASAMAATPAQLATSAAAATAVASQLTDESLGLLYYLPSSRSFYPSSPSINLNAWAAWLLDEAQGGGSPAAANALGAAAGAQLANASTVWRSAVASQLVKDAQAARAKPVNAPYKPEVVAPRIYSDWEELSWARLALGPAWAPPAEAGKDVAEDLALPRQLAVAAAPGNTSVGVQARTGLTLLQIARGPEAQASKAGLSRAAASAAADKLAAAMLASARVASRTAFVAAGPGSSSAGSAEDQALALRFLTAHAAGQQAPAQAAAARELLPKLAARVAGGGAVFTPGAAAACPSVGGTAAGTSAAALAAYDAGRGNTAPDAQLSVQAVSRANASAAATSAARPVLAASFTPASAAQVANATLPWSALPPQPELRFAVSGSSGEVSVAAGLQFVPARLLPFPSFRGLFVERVVANEAGEGSLAATSLADVVTVAVQLTSPDPLSGVVLEVLMPAGLEPVDPNVFKDASFATQCGLGGESLGPWFCPAQSAARGAVLFTWPWLPAGTVNVAFKATAATPGTFVLPPAKAWALSQPELMGLSGAGNFTVCPTRRGSNAAATAATGTVRAQGAVTYPLCTVAGQAAAPAAAAPMGCPRDCSGQGVCDLGAGACLCAAGFSGADCSRVGAV